MNRNVLFCGFGNLGTLCLSRLLESGYQVKCVLTHKSQVDDAVDTHARKWGIPYHYYVCRHHVDEIVALLHAHEVQVLVSINYRHIIPAPVLEQVRHKLNIHGSLLPRYRGRTPHVWSIINGEAFSGITAHVMEAGVDEGDIIRQVKIPIEETDTGYTLLKKFEARYPDLMVEALHALEIGESLVKQDPAAATYFGPRIPEMGYINFRNQSSEVINFVRAQASPYPGAYYFLPDGRKLIIDSIARIETPETLVESQEIGRVFHIDGRFVVRCFDSWLQVEQYRFSEALHV